MKRWMQWLALLLISLFAGAVLTITIAWGCLLWSPPENPRPDVQFKSGHRAVDAVSKYGQFDGFALFEYRGVGWELDHVMASSTRFHPSSPRNQNELTQVYAGWPLLCLEGERRKIAAKPGAWRIVTLPSLPGGNAVNRAYAPLQPRWIAFMANSSLFAALVLVLMRCYVIGNRTFRRWRGRCIQCKYELRGLLQGQEVRCPECGKLAKK